MKYLAHFFAFTLALLGFAGQSKAEQAPLPAKYVWVQMVAQDKVSLRALVSDNCKKRQITLGTQTQNLVQRGPNGMDPGVPIVCEAVIDLTSYSGPTVTFENHVINLPHTAPKRVLVLGDTGCRKDGGHHDQKCYVVPPKAKCKNPNMRSDPDCQRIGWFFKAIADAAGKTKPDMIVHVGDYVYRYNCGFGHQNKEGCHRQGQLKEWRYWDQDFFSQAAGILPAAPWLFVRGNHEDCEHKDRGWRGWSLFLSRDAQAVATDSSCITNQRQEAPTTFTLPAGKGPKLTLMALDTANEAAPDPSDFTKGLKGASEAWVLTHVPLWYGNAYYDNSDAQQLPAALDMVISGHEHLFRIFVPTIAAATGTAPATTGPVQILEGASGTKRDFNGPVYGYPANMAPQVNDVNSDFSFTILDRKANRTTDVVLCTVKRDGTATPHQAWTVSRGKNGMTSVPLTVTNNFCTSP